MKKLNLAFVALLGFALFAISCTPKVTEEVPQETKYDKAAKDLCACSNDSGFLDLYEKLLKAQEANDMEAMMSYVGEMEAVMPKFEACTNDLDKEYGDMSSEEDDKQMMAALEKHCPRMHKLVTEMKAMDEGGM